MPMSVGAFSILRDQIEGETFPYNYFRYQDNQYQHASWEEAKDDDRQLNHV